VSRIEPDVDDSIERLLKKHDPVTGFVVESKRLALIAAGASRTARKRRMPWQGWLALSIAAIVGLVVGAPALAGGVTEGVRFLAQTGMYDTPWVEGENGAEGHSGPDGSGPEWIDTGAADFDEYLTTIYPTDLPFPEGTTKSEYEAWFAGLFADSGPSNFDQAEGIQSMYEWNVRCLWVHDWLAADSAGDNPRADAAASIVRDSLDWPLLESTDGGGVTEHAKRLSDAMSAGDRDAAELELGGDCDFDVHS